MCIWRWELIKWYLNELAEIYVKATLLAKNQMLDKVQNHTDIQLKSHVKDVAKSLLIGFYAYLQAVRSAPFNMHQTELNTEKKSNFSNDPQQSHPCLAVPFFQYSPILC